MLEMVFKDITSKYPEVSLDTNIVSREVLREKLSHAYVVIVPSVSEVSPNLVLDGLAYGVPAVVTRDTGIADRLKDMVVFVDPLSPNDIVRGIESLLDPAVYDACSHAIMSQTFTHSWNEIAQEFIDVYEKL
jgi:glycosyltransferase involved in cell wall biosynthesis